jgi:hypothetical protein
LPAAASGAPQAQPATVVDTVIVLDTTASMRGVGGSKNIWEQVLATVQTLIAALPDGTRLAIIPFDGEPRLDRAFPPPQDDDLQPLALDAEVRAQLTTYFGALPADGQRTWIYEAVEFGLNRLRAWQEADSKTPHRPSIFVYSDGLDNGPHGDVDMGNISALYQQARADLPALYGFYGDVGEQLGETARQNLTNAGFEVSSGIPARAVSVQPATLDFGLLPLNNKEVTQVVEFDSRTPTVYGIVIRARLDTTAPVTLTVASFSLREQVTIGLRVTGALKPGAHQARLLLSAAEEGISINPPVIEVLFQGPQPTATPTRTVTASLTPRPDTPSPTPRPPTRTPAPTIAPTVDRSSPALVVAVGSNDQLPLQLASYDLTAGNLPSVEMLVITRSLELEWRVDREEPSAGLLAEIELDRALPVSLHVPDTAYIQTQTDSAPVGSIELKPDDRSLVITLVVPRSQLEALGYGDHPIKGRVILQGADTEVRGSVAPASESGMHEIRFVLNVNRSLPAALWITIGLVVLGIGAGAGVPLYVRLGIKRFAPGFALSLNGKAYGKGTLADWQKQGKPFPRAKLAIGSFRDQIDLGWGEEYSGLAELFADAQGQPWLRHHGRKGVHLYVRGQELRPGQAIKLSAHDAVRITGDAVQIVTEHILAVVDRTKSL